MKEIEKLRYLVLFCCCYSLLSLFACKAKNKKEQPRVEIYGQTMGTTYNIKAWSNKSIQAFSKAQIDSLLLAVNEDFNTYDSTSLISRFNKGETLTLPLVTNANNLQNQKGQHLLACLNIVEKPYQLSKGKFDPTVGPLVLYYGFGYVPNDTTQIDTNKVLELKQLVGFNKLKIDTIENNVILKPAFQNQYLDLSSNAKGFGIDQVFLWIQKQGFENIYVEIGGETRTLGNSLRQKPWRIGISTPSPQSALDDLQLALNVPAHAVATSGNYRNRRTKGGKVIGHTINPISGFPIQTNLLSATVIANDCGTADAFATACMAAPELAKEILIKANLSGCLIKSFDGGQSFEMEYIGDFEKLIFKPN